MIEKEIEELEKKLAALTHHVTEAASHSRSHSTARLEREKKKLEYDLGKQEEAFK